MPLSILSNSIYPLGFLDNAICGILKYNLCESKSNSLLASGIADKLTQLVYSE